MREIKFRVWNGSKMEYNVMAGFLGAFYVQGIDDKDSASMSSFNTKYPEPVHVMQFTGVLDKNGKEIFEGDIVQCGTVGIIKFEEGRFFYDYKHPEDPEHLDMCEIKKGVVIGNIHESQNFGAISI